ncbi:MAG: efflux transporter outer membrane subunit [Gammaproteobacteria bacterium]|jgi:NodT family efflux transporter outer membrane factor (OMF) lipoprotein
MHRVPEHALVRVSLICGVLAMNACTTLGPDYREPEVEWLADWRPDLYGQLGSAEQRSRVDLRFWWRLFDDPALNRLIESARRENPSLRIAGLRILESRARLGIAGSALYPQVQQLSGALDHVNTRQRGGDLPNDDRQLVSYQARFNLAWELDFWGRFRRGIESADAAFFASIANQQDVQVLLSAQVADLYFAYRTTELRIAIARENAALQKRSYEITERVYQSGEQSELDLQQARTQYLATLSTVPELQITLTKTRNALAALLGRPPVGLPELAEPIDRLPGIEPMLIADIPARLLMRRPDIRATAWQAAAQSAQIGIAEAEFYPAISLLGSIGWSGDDRGSSPNLGSLAVGSGFSWNIFDHGRIANNIRVQDAQLQQLLERYEDAVLQAAREIDDAAITIVKTAQQQQILHESARAARRSLELATTRYREGYSGFQRVLDAQQALFTQSERELVNQGNHVSAVIGLYKSLGGGWLETPVQQLIPADMRETMQERSDWGGLLDTPLPAAASNPPPASGSLEHE